MGQISGDKEFRAALDGLDPVQQRRVAARFVERVSALSGDERIFRVLKTAANPEASDDELATAFRTAKAAILDSYTRCGAECDWADQAGYFVARAATASVAPQSYLKNGNAGWQAAMSCRMARTCEAIDGADPSAEQDETEQQHRLLEEYLQQHS
jgi:hypothetical protein